MPAMLPDASISVGNGWYFGWGIADMMMAGLGGTIYYLYPYKISSN